MANHSYTDPLLDNVRNSTSYIDTLRRLDLIMCDRYGDCGEESIVKGCL